MLLGVNSNSCYSVEDNDDNIYNDIFKIFNLESKFIDIMNGFCNNFPHRKNNTLTNLMNNGKISRNFKSDIFKFFNSIQYTTIFICNYIKHNENNYEILEKLYSNMIEYVQILKNDIEIKINNTTNNISNMAESEDYIIEGVSKLYKIMNEFARSVKDNLSDYNLSDDDISHMIKFVNELLGMENELVQLKIVTLASHCLSDCDNTLKKIKLDKKTGNMTEENNNYNFMVDFDKIIKYFYDGIIKISEKYNISFMDELVNIITTFWRYRDSFCHYVENLPGIINDYPNSGGNNKNNTQYNKQLNKFAIHSINMLKNVLGGYVSYLRNKYDSISYVTSQNYLKNICDITELLEEYNLGNG